MARTNTRLFRLQTQKGGQEIKVIEDFAIQVGAKVTLRRDFITKKGNRYFLLNENLRKVVVRKNFYHAGTYLGKFKNGRFFPSFDLLALIARGATNKIVVDKKTAWLFICGRDVFKKGIMSMHGPVSRGTYTLVLNEYSECLGFGRITQKLDKESAAVVVKNISDIGDFLRREP